MAVNISFRTKVNKDKKKSPIPFKSIFIAVLFVVLSIAEIWSYGKGLFYIDEIAGIVSALYLFAFIRKIERRDAITIIILFAVVLIGLISNIVSNLAYSTFSILTDVVTETKTLFAFFALKYFLNDYEKRCTINLLVPFSQLFIISSFVLLLFNLFLDFGMRGESRYGIPSFKFIYHFNYQFIAVYMLVIGVIICCGSMSKVRKRRYYIIALFTVLFALKSSSTIFFLVFIFLVRYFRKHKRISLPIIIIGVIVIAITGWYQIQTYLVTEDSPRRLFIDCSIDVANRYFPLGSGFATFGSDQAKKYYAELYYYYGFDKIWGMTPTYPAFLNDTFWATIIAQFGWLGGIGYAVVFVRIFLAFNNKKYDNARKAFLYAVFIQYMIQSLGTPILANSAGMIGFVSMSLFALTNDEPIKRRKIKIRTK